ncbi:ABC transporter ATP-binding protein [Paenibacillus melissococcoides]|uniref:ABC transporter ATP-binding protein n=1 Tax=Paenibacillus melissococcoides TaxID=2912268 RepID=A0ABM9GAX9_9BACL|nr:MULTISPECIES: ABC transporter ATP-binding protein [Paenibacillus]MEB9892827.1 ABC transporter ATP-binding protein [Bacillus cereus]CAH8248952.1 ABC transporter ATP-binding protein [Paenibacillus melissococcoides]CAH8720779.1 ABC transporter ATP-binding protein [Paenibacillus melissococcoides]CAH8720884.1 ABC transporter ATP-binding protein [Paenibacillus melissococcoides]GIO80551.1 ABC transporter ATP-binding protein [Paenibacillus dendritiformis]
MENYVIYLKNIFKKYKLYHNPVDRLKESMSITGKLYHKEFYALKDVSLSVNKGETLGIIGKNGSGKSTLLKIITGVLTQTSGERTVHGQISALLELGTGFNPEYTGMENIYLNGTMRGLSREVMQTKIADIIEFADIGDFIHQPVKTYSSGMFARLAFSVMINFKPEILIVDEALSVGDVFFQQKCNRFMKEEMRDVTKLLVTHDLSSIANMADRVIVLSEGEVVFEGEPLKGIEYYTKILHTETFSSKKKVEQKEERSKTDMLLSGEWVRTDEESLGGAQEIIIEAVQFKIDDEEYKGFVTKGNKLQVELLISSRKSTDEMIVGYLVNDKFGNSIFGENSYSSNLSVPIVEENKSYVVAIEIPWPEIQENDYFITFGIGEGFHEMQHVIQCWAHNVIQVKNITLGSVHALFNNKIEKISMKEV